MAEIDKTIASDSLNFETSRHYAHTQKDLEKFRQQHYHTTGTTTIEQGIASSTSILVVASTPNQLDILTGVLAKHTWPMIEAPPHFEDQRPFSPYLAPSLGSPDNQEADIKKVSAVMEQINPSVSTQSNVQAELKGQPVINMLTELRETNLSIEQVRALMNQFKKA